MQIISQRSSPNNKEKSNTLANPTPYHYLHHGKRLLLNQHDLANEKCYLAVIPSETLTHITAFLDPKSLFALGRANHVLHEHVKDDNTWHRAFQCQFLNEGPEDGLLSSQTLLLRRTEESWKAEFVLRSNLLYRWEKCRNSSVAHTPHYSPVTDMHLLSDQSHGPALLSASLQYGIIARSHPLTGKVLKGYISATESGVGIGNPNVEFTPNVSASAILSEGWSAKILWGYGNGIIGVTTATKIMDVGKTTSRLVKCSVEDEHTGPVREVFWALQGDAFVTAGDDGIVKIWNSNLMKCVKILTNSRGRERDACVKLAVNLEQGFVVAAKQSGDVVVWTGVTDILAERASWTQPSIVEGAFVFSIPSPPSKETPPPARECSVLFLDPQSTPAHIVLGVQCKEDQEFYRVDIFNQQDQYNVKMTRFANGPLGPIRTLFPYFNEPYRSGESVILAGDSLGRVSFYDWNGEATEHGNGFDTVGSVRRLDAHDDGAITAVSCNAYIIVTGSSRGTIKVWDALTDRPLRSFSSPAARPEAGAEWAPVSRILLERELLFVSVGQRVLAWKADPVKPHKNPNKKRNGAKHAQNSVAKWQKRVAMDQDIAESRLALDDEHEHDVRTYERQRAQLSTLNNLGLDEVEAVEYVLMLSRDEEERRMAQSEVALSSEGVFEDFDDIPSAPRYTAPIATATRPYPTPAPSPPRSGWSSMADLRSPVMALTSSKVQVTPPFRPEPMEAGFSTSPLMISPASSLQGGRSYYRRPQNYTPPSITDTDHFPGMASSVSSSRSASVSVSPEIRPSVSWSEMLKKTSPPSSASRSPQSGFAVRSVAPSTRRQLSAPSGHSLLSDRLRGEGSSTTSSVSPSVSQSLDEDEELKYAIELSLAEALSRQDISKD